MEPRPARAGTDDAGAEAAAREAGRRLFAGPCRFVAGAARIDQLPPAGLDEVAFAGRSNVGKSSLINALTGRAGLARISRTPGRTQEINFFDLADRLVMVDLPGYGYARASKARIMAWSGLVRDYLRGRARLRRTCLLIDPRQELKDSDREVMALLDAAAVSYQLVLTKCDKLEPAALAARKAAIEAALARRPAAHPLAIATSARTGTGIDRLRTTLAALAAPAPVG